MPVYLSLILKEKIENFLRLKSFRGQKIICKWKRNSWENP